MQPIAASRPSVVLALAGCLLVLPGATECSTAAPPADGRRRSPRRSQFGQPVAARRARAVPRCRPGRRVARADDADGAAALAGARLEAERNVIDVFKAAAPATVFVTQKRMVRDWSMRALEVPAGTGTGFLWDRRGTWSRTITWSTAGAAQGRYSVTLHSQKTYDAELLGGDPNKDVAVLKLINCDEPLTPLPLLPPEVKLEVGQTAIAIGNPFGLDHTLTTGVISALGREVQGYGGVTIRDMIQTDASINPGNSGGPLIDSGGYLIGMNTMIFSKTGSSAGIGFAVPVSVVRRVVPQVIPPAACSTRASASSRCPTTMRPRARASPGSWSRGCSRARRRSRPASAACSRTAAGEILLGDIIVGIDAHAVEDYDDLYNAFDRYKVGDEVSVKLIREAARPRSSCGSSTSRDGVGADCRATRCYARRVDQLRRAIKSDFSLRVVAAVTTELVAEACDRHALRGVEAVALGRALTAGCLLTTLTKHATERLRVRAARLGAAARAAGRCRGDGSVRGCLQRLSS
jgi:S1-C subfamily serine protease